MSISYKVAVRLTPSANRAGYVNVQGPDGRWLSVLPDGSFAWGDTNPDANYQQFKRNGLALEIAPGDDANPSAPTFVLLPSEA